MEPLFASFEKLTESYFEMWHVFATALLTDSTLLHQQDRVRRQRAIPPHLQAAYRLLHLQGDVSLTELHAQYRKLAKRYHPDAGGNHADFLALQRAYEQVMKHLQTRRPNEDSFTSAS
jgi:DnaJ-class molecular chaperone